MDYLDNIHIPFPHQQQIGESNIDYKRFVYYKDLGAKRSLKKVSEFFGVTDRRIEQISSKNHWVDRIHAINKVENEQIISTVLSYVGETARDLAEEIKPVIFNIISEISEKDLRQMNPTELKGLLDVCYKIINRSMELDLHRYKLPTWNILRSTLNGIGNRMAIRTIE